MKPRPLYFTLIIALFFASCEEQVLVDEHTPILGVNSSSTEAEKIEFGRVLSKAISDEEVRGVLKEEALKMFDMDYDVLLQLVKDKKLRNGQTFAQRLSSYAESQKEFEKIISNNPLLTIFIPNLNHFSAETWNTNAQVPIVGIVNEYDKQEGRKMIGFTELGKRIELEYHTPPNRPIILVKDNERVMVSSKNKSSANSRFAETRGSDILNTDEGTFYFTSENFNGISSDKEIFDGQSLRAPRPVRQPLPGDPRPGGSPPRGSGGISCPGRDSKVQQAEQFRYPRDYVYYGISPELGINEGGFNDDYREYITGLRLKSVATKNQLYNDPATDYTDGQLEIFIKVVYINNSGGLSSTEKGVSVNIDDLVYTSSNRSTSYTKTYSMCEALIPWDFQRYGDTWKFIITEYDQGTEITYKSEIESKFGTNFKVGGKKEGVNFGLEIEASETRSKTFEVKTTTTSDKLGEGELLFKYPLVVRNTGRSRNPWKPFTISTGTGFIELTIQPKNFR